MAFNNLNARQHEVMSQINVVPLVDVMLVLMVVFLVTAPLMTLAVNVRLPVTAAIEGSDRHQPLQVGIDAQGGFSLNQQTVADEGVLERALRAEWLRDNAVGVHFYADEAVAYGHVLRAMATVQRAGITRMAFVSVEGP